MTTKNIIGSLLALLIIGGLFGLGLFWQFNSDYPFIEPLADKIQFQEKLGSLNSTEYNCRLSDSQDTVHFSLNMQGETKAALTTGFAIKKSAQWVVVKYSTRISPIQ